MAMHARLCRASRGSFLCPAPGRLDLWKLDELAVDVCHQDPRSLTAEGARLRQRFGGSTGLHLRLLAADNLRGESHLPLVSSLANDVDLKRHADLQPDLDDDQNTNALPNC